MKGSISIKEILKKGNLIEIKFIASKELRKFFNSDLFKLEFDEKIESVPDSIAIIPFVCNVLPIVWLTGSVLNLRSIDADFMSGYPEILNGYKNMYPNMNFSGYMKADKIEENRSRKNKNSSKSAALFSGGVDAFATLIAHAEEHPRLITIWGADVKLNDEEGWSIVWNHVLDTAKVFNIKASCIKSNFRDFLNYKSCSDLVKVSGDNYWHGFQHGIALISHVSPIAWKHGIQTLYIASSHTIKKKNVPCASDPTIDNYVKFADCVTVHDQYEYERSEKVEHIIDFVKRTKTELVLRVCWISTGGKNCCQCEKCLRTMLEIFTCDDDPKRYGFNYSSRGLRKAKYIIMDSLSPVYTPYYKDISDKVKKNPDIKLPRELEWLRSIDYAKPEKCLGYKVHKIIKITTTLLKIVLIKTKLIVKIK